MDAFESKLARKMKLRRTFTPAAPVSKRKAFSGRFEQITDVVAAVMEPGRHIVLYGERGVGKTSLANILSELLIDSEGQKSEFAVRVTCNTDDTFRTIWNRALKGLGCEIPEEWKYADPNPDDLRRILQDVSPPMVIVFDEYDRVENDEALSGMADTIKALSDHIVSTKIVIVGVSDSIEALIGEHESVKRAIKEVQMPRMSRSEIMELVSSGFHGLGMTIVPDALIRITKIAEGLPTYAHLLALKSGERAIDDDRDEIFLSHIEHAVGDVLDTYSNRAAYLKAVQSPRSENLYKHVLVACAIAEKDPLGYFTPRAVREPLTRIMGRQYDIPAFAGHLKAFLEDDRGSVLQRVGQERSFRYRFRDPLLQPFVLLSGIVEKIIPDDYALELFEPDPEVDWDKIVLKLNKVEGRE